MTQDKCQGCAVQQGYVPVGAVAQIQDASRLPEIKDMLNSPQTLNNNDRAFWVLGWNECRDAAKSLIAHIAELEAQLAAVQQGVPLFYFNPSDAKNYQNAQSRFDCGALPVSKKPCSYYTSPLYTHPTQQGLDAATLDADMFWDDDDSEQQYGSIEEFLNVEICNGYLEVGQIRTMQRGIRLPNIYIRVTAIDEEESEATYEIIDAALAAQAKQGEQA